jgi:aldehyde dehydrogenase (NAD+)
MDLEIDGNYGLFINNEFIAGTNGEILEARNPATGELLATLTKADAHDVERAIDAARRAFPKWSKTPIEERSGMLNALANALEADMARSAAIDTEEMGRRLFETNYDQIIAISHYRYFAAAVMTHEGFGRRIPGGQFFAVREPLGVCAQIVPWNVPAIMVASKLAPALAAGNTVVLKPDENASISTLELCKKIAKIFPAGVVNVITGAGESTGAALINHPGVDKISFTGSTEVGRLIGRVAADALLPVTLELGGKSPNIVFPDVTEVDALADNIAFAAMYCNGQSCLAGTRLFLHEDIYGKVMDKLLERLSRAVVGPPTAEDTTISCLVSAKQGERVLDYIRIGREEGAKLVFGGSRREVQGCEAGYFIEPTVFEADNGMRIAQEEIFGPVLSVMRWSDYESMIEEANDSRYGLASGIYTNDLSLALTTAERLQAGSVWINQYFNLMNGTPFGGYKESGLGREFCHDTLNHYTQLKSITMVTGLPEPFYIK